MADHLDNEHNRELTRPQEAGSLHQAAPNSSVASGKASVLIADDDFTLSHVLTEELTQKGYSVHAAADGKTAISLIDREDVDLAVLDIMMPTLNGFGVLKHIKETKPRVKVIMLTAYGDLANAMEAKRLGADDFIGKPYQIEDLLMSFERLLRS